MVLPLSAHNKPSLKANIASLADSLPNLDPANALYTLAARKSTFSRRAFAVVEAASLKSGISADALSFGKAPSAPSQRLAFVFTGQGAQWPEMGAKLFHQYTVFRQSIQYMDNVLEHLHEKPPWTLEELLFEPAVTSRVHYPAVSQTLCTALQVALVNLLRQWGIQPVATVGHSSGTYQCFFRRVYIYYVLTDTL